MKKIISILIALMFIVGCTNKTIEEDNGSVTIVNTDKSDYNYVAPFDATYSRFNHNVKDYMEIGKGLVEISKEYFPTATYDLKEGVITSSYKNEFQPLIHLRESKDNPFGLNPEGTTVVKVNDQTEVTGPLLVSDLYEVNFVTKTNPEDIAGISLALVLNKSIRDDNGNAVSVDDKVLYEFATEIAGPKLESYLRKKPELNNVPIVIAIYVTDSANESIPGNFIAQAKYENRQGQFTKINHKWAIFPTKAGRDIDGNIDEQIASMKRSVSSFLPEDIGIVGYGEFQNDQLVQLKISVNVQTKTYTEVWALSNHIGNLIKDMNTNVPIKVEIKSLNTTLAIVVRDANTSKAVVTIM